MKMDNSFDKSYKWSLDRGKKKYKENDKPVVENKNEKTRDRTMNILLAIGVLFILALIIYITWSKYFKVTEKEYLPIEQPRIAINPIDEINNHKPSITLTL